MRTRRMRRLLAALMALALGLAAVGVGQSQQISRTHAPQVVADPGGNGSGSGG